MNNKKRYKFNNQIQKFQILNKKLENNHLLNYLKNFLKF